MAGRFLVYVEGQTEVVYIRELIREYHCQDLGHVVQPADNSPRGLVKALTEAVLLSQSKDKNPYETGWAIFDQDQHRYYETAINEAKKTPFIHVVWSNPCIEAWFLMHFPEGLKGLPFDAELIVSHQQKKSKINEDFYERITVDRYREVINPKTALSRLKELWKGYKKNSPKGYLSCLRDRLNLAMSKENNTTNPIRPGSSFPGFIEFLQSLGETARKQKKQSAVCRFSNAEICESAADFSDLSWLRNSSSWEEYMLTWEEYMLKLVPATLSPKYGSILTQVGLEQPEKAMARFLTLKDRLKKFCFASDYDLCLAFCALMTAALGKTLPHSPYIVLNGDAKGSANKIFETLLLSVMRPASEFRYPFPQTQEAVRHLIKKKVPYVVYKAGGRLENNAWLQDLWKKDEAPLVVIVGDSLNTRHLADCSLEIHFSKPTGSLSAMSGSIEAEAKVIRKTLFGMSVYMNAAKQTFGSETRPLFFWRNMVQRPCEDMELIKGIQKLNAEL
jgi:hypothetical protein